MDTKIGETMNGHFWKEIDALAARHHSSVPYKFKTLLSAKRKGNVLLQLHMHSREPGRDASGQIIGSEDVPSFRILPGKYRNSRISINKRAKKHNMFIGGTEHSYKHKPWLQHESFSQYYPSVEAMTDFEDVGFPLEFLLINLPKNQKTVNELYTASFGKTSRRFFDLIAQHNIFTIIAHPFYQIHDKKPVNKKKIAEIATKYNFALDFNAQRFLGENIQTIFLAHEYNIPYIATNDSHSGALVNSCISVDADSKSDALAQVRSGNYSIVTSFSPLETPWIYGTYLHQCVFSEDEVEIDLESTLLRKTIKYLSQMKKGKSFWGGLAYIAGNIVGMAHWIFHDIKKIYSMSHELDKQRVFKVIKNTLLDVIS